MPAPVAEPPAPLPRRVQALSREFSITLSRTTVGAGDVTIEFNNAFAEDPHDLNVAPQAGGRTIALGELPSGRVSTHRLALAPGRYRLFCSLAGHEALGMRATLEVAGS